MSCGSRILRGLMPKSPSWSGLFGFKGVEGKTGYFRRMLKWRFLGVITTLPSRASHPMAHSKMGPFPSTSFLSCASESSPWVLRTYQMAPAIWPMSSSTVTPILIMLSQLSPDDCHWRRERKESGLSPLRLSSAVRAGAETDLVRSRILRVVDPGQPTWSAHHCSWLPEHLLMRVSAFRDL